MKKIYRLPLLEEFLGDEDPDVLYQEEYMTTEYADIIAKLLEDNIQSVETVDGVLVQNYKEKMESPDKYGSSFVTGDYVVDRVEIEIERDFNRENFKGKDHGDIKKRIESALDKFTKPEYFPPIQIKNINIWNSNDVGENITTAKVEFMMSFPTVQVKNSRLESKLKKITDRVIDGVGEYV